VSCGCATKTSTKSVSTIPVNSSAKELRPRSEVGAGEPKTVSAYGATQPSAKCSCSESSAGKTGGTGCSCGGSCGCGCSGIAKHAGPEGIHPPTHEWGQKRVVDPVRGAKQPVIPGMDIDLVGPVPIVVPQYSALSCVPAHEELRPRGSFWSCDDYLQLRISRSDQPRFIVEPPQSANVRGVIRRFATSSSRSGAAIHVGRHDVAVPEDATLFCRNSAHGLFARFARVPLCAGSDVAAPTPSPPPAPKGGGAPPSGGGGSGGLVLDPCFCACQCPPDYGLSPFDKRPPLSPTIVPTLPIRPPDDSGPEPPGDSPPSTARVHVPPQVPPGPGADPRPIPVRGDVAVSPAVRDGGFAVGPDPHKDIRPDRAHPAAVLDNSRAEFLVSPLAPAEDTISTQVCAWCGQIRPATRPPRARSERRSVESVLSPSHVTGDRRTATARRPPQVPIPHAGGDSPHVVTPHMTHTLGAIDHVSAQHG